jgi:hypothetical protein
MFILYDIENYPNFFSIVTLDTETKNIEFGWVHDTGGIGGNLIEILERFNKYTGYFVGYNNFHYDDRIINKILYVDKQTNYAPIKLLYQNTYESRTLFCQIVQKFAEDIINNREGLDKANKYSKRFKRIDLMKINRLKKGLKQVAINLKANNIQDLPFAPGQRVSERSIAKIIDYNKNDVTEYTKRLFIHSKEEIDIRLEVGREYNIDVATEDRSGTANKFLEKKYSAASLIPIYHLKKLRTITETVSLSECISKKIRFSTPYMQRQLEELKKQFVTQQSKLNFKLKINNTEYTLAKGGIHSDRSKEIFKSSKTTIIKDCDVASFYPFLILNFKIYPAHLDKIFLELYRLIVNQRIEFKEAKRFLISEALKIVVNSIFGKYGDENYWLYDIRSMYRVTINGQLSLLMLIEKLEQSNIEVIYANTDGITVKMNKDQEDMYMAICEAWQKTFNFKLEFTEYSKLIIRDVNCYIAISNDNKIKLKGIMPQKEIGLYVFT